MVLATDHDGFDYEMLQQHARLIVDTRGRLAGRWWGRSVVKRHENTRGLKASALDAWLDLLTQSHTILAMDAAICRAWVRLMHKQSNTFYEDEDEDEDAMIVASAQVHGLQVVSRNVADLAALGFSAINPFTAAQYNSARQPPDWSCGHLVYANDAQELRMSAEALGMRLYVAVSPHLISTKGLLPEVPGVKTWPWAFAHALLVRYEREGAAQ